MKLIDADALKEELAYKSPATEFDIDSVVLGVIDEQPTAFPWHRVEEPPKKDGKYLVCWKDSGGFCYDTAWWTSVGTWALSHWTGVTVTHWMYVEPPKEDA